MDKSLLGKYWQQRVVDEDLVNGITRGLGVSDFLARLLSVRVSSPQQAMDFLDPKIRRLLPDPFHLLDMDKAISRVIKAIRKKEKICIFADYDVDGATSSSLIKNVFRQLGIEISIYVPDRIAEGYGPTPESMTRIYQSGASLLITVDCGSMAFEALEIAASLRLEVIVIDHHISADTLPKAVAVINPNRLDETSEHKNLAAVGVSFLFCVALIAELKKINFFEQNSISVPNLIEQLDIVALGTVCDVMTLTGLNRGFVSQGLKISRQRNNIGLTALSDLAGLDGAINCYHLGFILGPRINAGGRVGKADLGANLLSSVCRNQASVIAEELCKYNEERKAIELVMLEEAYDIASTQADQPILFIVGEDWHPGVIGIIAGRLKEQYNKPVAVIALQNGIGRASCRSVRGIDFGTKIMEAKNLGLLVAGGGHQMAAGFTVMAEKLSALREYLNQAFATDLLLSDAHTQEYYDSELTLDAANLTILTEIDRLEPYGNGNPPPVFKFEGVYVLKADIISGRHLRVLFAPARDSYSSKALPAIAFNSAGTELARVIMSPKPLKLSIFGSLKLNKWQDKNNVQLQLKDVMVEAC